MPVIYQPRGKAREYNPLACNLYIGCSHRCNYCYAPHALQKRAEDYFGTPAPHRVILAKIEPEEPLALIDAATQLGCIDLYKVGKLSGHKYPAPVDWNDFLTRAIEMIRSSGSQVYIKQDLRESASDVQLRLEETQGA